MPLRAAVADIGRLQNPEAMLLHIVRTMLAAGDIAGFATLAVPLIARPAYVLAVSAFPTEGTGVV